MKYALRILILCGLVGASALTQAQSFDLATFGTQSPNIPDGVRVDTDPAGNVYVLGVMQNASDIQGITASAPYSGSDDLFCAKFDPNGNVLWHIPFGAHWYDKVGDIFATSDAVYLSYHVQNTPVIFPDYNFLIDDGQLLTKLGPDGSHRWTLHLGNGYGHALAASEDAVYVAKQTALSGNGWITKLDTSGTTVWEVPFDMQGNFEGAELNATADRLALTGYYNNYFAATGTIDATSLPHSGGNPYFVTLVLEDLDQPSPTIAWLDVIQNDGGGSSSSIRSRDLAFSPSGEVLICGNGIDFDFGSESLLSTHAEGNLFVGIYAMDGTPVQLKQGIPMSTASFVRMYDLKVRSNGEIVACGQFNSSALDFDGTLFWPGTSSATSFAIWYHADYSVKSFHLGEHSLGTTKAESMTVDGLDRIYLAGFNFSSGAYYSCHQVAQQQGFFLARLVDEDFSYDPTLSHDGSLITCEGLSYTMSVPVDMTSIQWYLNGVAIPGETSPVYEATEAGSYTVEVGKRDCLDELGPVVLTLLASPDKPVISVSGSLLTANSGYTTYQWYLDGTPIPGADMDQYTAVANGEYTVEGFNADSCSALSDPVTIGATGIDVAMNGVELTLLSSSGGHLLQVKGLPSGAARLSLLGIDGRVLQQMPITDGSHRLPGLPSGIYLLRLASQGKFLDRKVFLY